MVTLRIVAYDVTFTEFSLNAKSPMESMAWMTKKAANLESAISNLKRIAKETLKKLLPFSPRSNQVLQLNFKALSLNLFQAARLVVVSD